MHKSRFADKKFSVIVEDVSSGKKSRFAGITLDKTSEVLENNYQKNLLKQEQILPLSTAKVKNGRLTIDKDIIAQSKGFSSDAEYGIFKSNNLELYNAMGGINYYPQSAPVVDTNKIKLSNMAIGKIVDRYNNTNQDEINNIIHALDSGDWINAGTMKNYSEKINSYVDDRIALSQLGYLNFTSEDEQNNVVGSLKTLKDYVNNRKDIFSRFENSKEYSKAIWTEKYGSMTWEELNVSERKLREGLLRKNTDGNNTSLQELAWLNKLLKSQNKDVWNAFVDYKSATKDEQREMLRKVKYGASNYDNKKGYIEILKSTTNKNDWENTDEYISFVKDWYSKNGNITGARQAYGISKGYVDENGYYNEKKEKNTAWLNFAETMAYYEAVYGSKDNLDKLHEKMTEYHETVSTNEEFVKYYNEMQNDPKANLYIGKGKKIYDKKNKNISDKEYELVCYYLGKDGNSNNYYFTWLEDVVYKREVAAKKGWTAVTDGESLKYHRLLSDYTKDAPLEANALSVVLNLGSGAELVYNTLNGDIKESKLSKASSKIREAYSNTHDGEFLGIDHDLWYNTGMSIVDSLASRAVGGPYALAFSAAASGVNDALDRGISEPQALLNGIANGINEYIFESISFGQLDELMASKGAGFKTFLKNVLNSGFTNWGEETLTEASNFLYDRVFNGDLSQYALNVQRYVDNGYTEEQAKKQTLKDLKKQIEDAGVSGLLMGLFFGVIGGSNAQINASIYGNNKYGSSATGINALVENGLAMPKDSAAYTQAFKANERLKSGKNLSGTALYNLATAIESEIESKSQARLIELGVDKKSAKELAPIMAKAVFGEQLTSQQSNMINSNEYAKQIVHELSSDRANTIWKNAIKQNKTQTETILSSYMEPENMQALINEGINMPKSSLAHTLALQYQDKINSGNSLSETEIIQLVKANEQAFKTEDISKITSAAESRLNLLGETSDASKLASIIVKKALGQRLTTSEENILNNSKYGQRVYNELNLKNVISEKYASDWAKSIGTNWINKNVYNTNLQLDENIDVDNTESDAPNIDENDFDGSQSISEYIKTHPQYKDFNGETVEEFIRYKEFIDTSKEDSKNLNGDYVPTSSSVMGSGDEYFGGTKDIDVSHDGDGYDNVAHLTTAEGGASPQGEAIGIENSKDLQLSEPALKDIARAPTAQEAIEEAITGKQKTDIQRHIVDICKKLDSNITVEFVDKLEGNGKFIRNQNKILIRSDLNAVQMYVEVFKHEFMHRLETKQLYSKFFNYCFKNSKAFEQYVRTEIKTAGVEIDAATREGVLQAYTNYKYEQYKNSRDIPKVDRDAFTKENAQEEIIADFFAQILFQGKQYRARIIEALENADGESLIGIGDEISSKAALLELQQKEPTLLEQVVQWFKDVINRLRGLPQAKSLVEQLDNEINLLESMARRAYQSKDSKRLMKKLDEIKFSLMNNNTFESNVDNIATMNDADALQNKEEGNFVRVMYGTPAIVRDNVSDAENLDVIISFYSLYLATRKNGILEGHYHNLGSETIKKLPEYISNPDAIVRTNNDRLNLFAQISTEKGNNGILSIELNTVKDINNHYDKYNLVITVFSANDNYTKNNIIKNTKKIEYQKENLLQVNPQLYEWLAIVNNKSSFNSIAEKEYIVNNEDSKRLMKKKLAEEKYSIVDSFTDDNGVRYDNAVLLDTNFFDGLSSRNWGKKLKEYVYNRSANNPIIMPIIDEKGSVQQVQFANPDDRVTKNGASNHKVIDKLSSSSDNVSKLSVLHVDEIVEVSQEDNPYYTNEHNHQWLDENGWLHRTAYVINAKNGNIYNITMDIAKTADGRTILYATDGKIKKVGNVQVNSLNVRGSGLNSNSKESLSQPEEDVKEKQFDIIQNTNPAPNTYNTWIRAKDDILTWEEVLQLDDESIGQFVWGDFSRADAEQALKDGIITVYSSYPIKNGVFVSTSYIQAQEYAGGKNGKVYSKTIPLTDVAWINGDEGQYAEIGEAQKNTADGNSVVKFSERDYPIDADVATIVNNSVSAKKDTSHILSTITAEQNKAINRLNNQSKNDLYRGKYTGGKHRFSDTMIKHALKEHGDFLREGLRAQLPITKKDIARHLSAIKDNKSPSTIKPTKTKRGTPSIVTSYEINGYTLYAEEITKSLGKNLPSDLIGHTMYKAPTLATAAALATSARAQPKRQSTVLCKYYIPKNGNLSTANFIADKNGKPALLSYATKNSNPKVDVLLGGLIALSSDENNFTDVSGDIEQGYVRCRKPFYITQDNKVFSNSETDVAAKLNELKVQGYDCFIFDYNIGDNYLVAVFNEAQIVKNTNGNVIPVSKKTDNTDDKTMRSDRDPAFVSEQGFRAENSLNNIEDEAVSKDNVAFSMPIGKRRNNINKNVVELSKDNELSKRIFGLYSTEKYKEIQKYIFDVLGGQNIVLSDGKKATVDKSDARHISQNAGSKKAAQISAIKELVEKAVLIAEEESNKGRKFDYFYYYEAAVKYDGEIFNIYLNVGRATNDKSYHLYDITQKLRDTAHRINGVGRPKPDEGYALKNGISNNIIPKTANNVNNDYSTNTDNIEYERLNDKEQKYIQNICDKLGRNVVFEDLREMYYKGEIISPDGYIENEVIHLNTYAENPIGFVFKHELTHFAEKASGYAEFVRGVKNSNVYKKWLCEKMGESDVKIAEYKYKQMVANIHSDIYSASNPKAEAEMIADFVGEMLFTENGSGMASLVSDVEVKQRNKVVQFVLDLISYLKKKLSGMNSLTLELSRLEDRFNALLSDIENIVVYDDEVKFSFGITQKDIDDYVDAAYKKENTEDYKKYAVPTQKLIDDVSNEIDITDYSHALRDNDIRHIKNSHGEGTNEKYPVTSDDIKLIPWIVQNYDKVFVKTNSRGKPGVLYVKVAEDNVIYYVEAVTEEYHTEKLLVNKQMIKTGIDDIPNLYGLNDAINKKMSSSQYLADLKKIRKAYVRDVKENYSDNIIPKTANNVNNDYLTNTDIFDDEVRFSLKIKHANSTVEEIKDARNLTDEQAVEYLKQAKRGELRRETYIPIRKDTPSTIINTLGAVGIDVQNRSLIMQVRKAQQAMSSTNNGSKSKKHGNNIRSHGMSAEQIVDIVKRLDNPTAMILQTNRYNQYGEELPDNVAVFVEYNNDGKEGVAIVEFDSSIDSEFIGTEFGDANYHTVVTIFEPDTERYGMPFDYIEELLANPDNYELEIVRRQPARSATGEKHPNTSSELPSSDIIFDDLENVNNIDSTNTDNIEYDAISEQEQKYIQTICDNLGRTVVFEDLREMYYKGEIISPDGYIENGIIHLNLYAENPIGFVFKHELTHFAEKASGYAEFVRGVKNSNVYKKWLCEKMGESDIKIAEYKYKQMVANTHSDIYSASDPKAEAEMIADFVGEMLFTENGSGMASLVSDVEVKQRNKVVQFVLDLISWLKKKLGGMNSLTLELSRLEDRFNELLSDIENIVVYDDEVKFSFGITQKDIDDYVDAAYKKENTEDYKKYAVPTQKLIDDVSNEIDITDYSHALRDNDIRHIKNSHGEGTNEKYPVTSEDIKLIPWIVQNYDRVFVVKREKGKIGIIYVKVNELGLIYFLEQVTTVYGNEPLLVNKQMIKTGIDNIPNLKGFVNAINKKQSETEFLADLKKVHEVYAQSVNQPHFNNIISNFDKKVNYNDVKYSEQKTNRVYNSKDSEWLVNKELNDTQYLIGGENSKTANHSLLFEAKLRAYKGEDSETIRKDTGWYKGRDGKWRYYIPDNEINMPEGNQRQGIDVDAVVAGMRGEENYESNAISGTQSAVAAPNGDIFSSVDNVNDINYNKNEKAEGENYGSENSELLEKRRISATGGSGNILWKQGTNSEKLATWMGVSQRSDATTTQTVRVGESGWIRGRLYAQRKDSEGFKQSIFRKIRGVSLSGKDTIGGIVNQDIIEKFKHTICKDENGNLLSLYHWTNKIFAVFTEGEFGFHFGTLQAAHDRYLQLKEESPNISKGVYKEVILNITNPIELSDDNLQWTADWVAFQLLQKGIINEYEYNTLQNMSGINDISYDNPAAEAVREILSKNGYDGIIYENRSEDIGSYSIIALYPEQIITVAENGILKKNSGINRATSNDEAAFSFAKTQLAQGIDENAVIDGMWDEKTSPNNSQLRIDQNNDIIESEKNYTDEDCKAAVLRYKSGESYIINEMLRENQELDEFQHKFVNTLDAVLQQLPTYKGTVYRNVVFDDIGDENVYRSFLKRYIIGAHISYKQYLSCSKEQDGYPVEGKLKVHFVIEGETARDVDGFGNNMESEVIFARDTFFVVKNIDLNTEYPIIYLQEETANDRYNAYEKSRNAVRNLQAPYTVYGDLQGIPRQNTKGDIGRGFRSQSAVSERQWGTVRGEGRNGTVLPPIREEHKTGESGIRYGDKRERLEDKNAQGEIRGLQGINGTSDPNFREKGTELSGYGNQGNNRRLNTLYNKEATSNDEVAFSIPIGKRKNVVTEISLRERNSIKDICRRLGVEVLFEDLRNIKDKDGNIISPDGYVGKDGVIHLNIYAENPIGFVFKHELTHFAERSQNYKEFVRQIKKSTLYKNWLKQKTNESNVKIAEYVYKKQVVASQNNINSVQNPKAEAEMIADFTGDMLFTDNGSGMLALTAELDTKPRNAVVRFIIDFISWLKKKISGVKSLTFELSILEDSFNKLLSDAKNFDVYDGAVMFRFGGSRGAEKLYNTLEVSKPENDQEWSEFNRQFANKTSDLKNRKQKNIIICTEKNVYFVSASGYMAGCIEWKMHIDGNEDIINKMIKEYSNGTFAIGKIFSSSVEGKRREYRRGDRDSVGTEGRDGQSENLNLDERQSKSDDVGYNWENYGYKTWEELIDAIDSGALIMDDNGNILTFEKEKHIKAALNDEVAFSMPIGKRRSSSNNIIELSKDNELFKRVGNLRGAEKYKVIQQYILEVLGGEEIVLSDGKVAVVDKSDALHIANKAANKKTAQISEIKKLIEKAKLVAEEKSTKGRKFDYFYYYATTVKYDGEIFNIYLDVGRASNDGTFHIYDITNKIRDTANRINGLERPKPNEGYALTNGISNNSITNLKHNVNNNSLTQTDIFNDVQELNSDEVKYIKNICRRLGVEVLFEDLRNIKDKDGNIISPDGYVGKDGVIHLNIYAENPIGFVFKHELTHFAERSQYYEEFVRQIKKSTIYKNWLKQKTNESNVKIAEYVYKKQVVASQNNINSLQNPKAEAEMIADFTGDMLFTDNGSGMLALTAELDTKPRNAVVRFITDFISWLKKKFVNGQSYMTYQLSVLEDGFNRLLSEATNLENNSQHEDNNVKFSIAGEHSKTANHSLLFEAKLRAYKGEDSETIRKDTGWYKGRDGKWRYYIPDNELNIDRLIEFAKSSEDVALLGDVITHDKLFAAYPELKSVKVEFKNLKEHSYGEFVPNKNIIYFDYGLLNNREMFVDVLIHETQHAIQVVEGFARGGNEKTGFYYAINTTYDMVSRSEQFNNLATKEEKFDYLCNIALKLFDANSLEELAYKSYLKIYGEVEAREVSKYHEYDENLLKLVEPIIDGNVVSFKTEENKFFTMLKLLGYNDSEIKELFKKVGITGVNKRRNGYMDSRGDISGVQRGRNNIRGINESGGHKRINIDTLGDRGWRTVSLNGGPNSRVTISNKGSENKGKLLETGVRATLSTQEKSISNRGLDEKSVIGNTELEGYALGENNTGKATSNEEVAFSMPVGKKSNVNDAISEQEQKYIQNICDKLGRTVVFEDLRNITDKEGRIISPDGYIDKDGIMHLNLYGENPIGFVFKHELTHFAERAQSYEEFVRQIKKSSLYKDWLKQKTKETDIKIAEYVYKKQVVASQNNITSVKNPKAEAEMIADFVGEMLFTENGSGMLALTAELDTKPRNAVVRFITDFISWLKKKFVNGQSYMTYQLSVLEDGFNRLLSEAGQTNNIYGFNTDTKSQQLQAEENNDIIENENTSKGDSYVTEEQLRNSSTWGQFEGENTQNRTRGLQENDGRIFGNRQENFKRFNGTEVVSNQGYNRGINTYKGDSYVTEEQLRNSSTWGQFEGENTQSRTRGLQETGGGIFNYSQENKWSSRTVRNQGNNRGIKLSDKRAQNLKTTAIKNEDGTPKTVYHFTSDMNFEIFAKGDIGFHFGNESQAKQRGVNLKQRGRIISAHLDIRNPIYINTDLMSWYPAHVAVKLYADGIITNEQYLLIRELHIESGYEYNSPAAVKLREILSDLGYDGIVYENHYEGIGKSYIAFYPEQIITVDDGKTNKSKAASNDEAASSMQQNSDDVSYCFTRCFDEELINAAEEMESDGFDSYSIWKELNVVRGIFGDWEQEIDINGFKFFPNGNATTGSHTPNPNLKQYNGMTEGVLSDFVYWNELYEKYPRFKNIRVIIRNASFSYDTARFILLEQQPTLFIDKKLCDAYAQGKSLELKALVLRELQRIIQYREGRYIGKSLDYWKNLERRGKLPFSQKLGRQLTAEDMMKYFVDNYEAELVAQRQRVKDVLKKAQEKIGNINDMVAFMPMIDPDEAITYNDRNKLVTVKESDSQSRWRNFDNHIKIRYNERYQDGVATNETSAEYADSSESAQTDYKNKVIETGESARQIHNFVVSSEKRSNRQDEVRRSGIIKGGNSGFAEKIVSEKYTSSQRYDEQLYGAYADLPIADRDTIGRNLGEDVQTKLSGTFAKNENGEPLSFYFVNRYDKNLFKHAQLGLIVGTVNMAVEKFNHENELRNTLRRGFCEEYYAAIKKPLYLPFEPYQLSVDEIGFYMVQVGLMSRAEYQKLIETKSAERGPRYDNNMARKLRERLKKAGYDSLVFENQHFDAGSMSLVIFDADQLIPVAKNGILIEGNGITDVEQSFDPDKDMTDVQKENQNPDKLDWFLGDSKYRRRRKIPKPNIRIRAGSSGWMEKQSSDPDVAEEQLYQDLERAYQTESSGCDAAGREFSRNLKKETDSTVFKAHDGDLLSFFVWGFDVSDVDKLVKSGTQFKTFDSAFNDFVTNKQRYPSGINGLFKEFYINAVSPLIVRRNGWNTASIADMLFENGKISQKYYSKLLAMAAINKPTYNNAAAKNLREQLKLLGYDSIIFINENGEKSVTVFDPSQIICVSTNGILEQDSNITQTDEIASAVQREDYKVSGAVIKYDTSAAIDIKKVESDVLSRTDNTAKLKLLTEYLECAKDMDSDAQTANVGYSGLLERGKANIWSALARFNALIGDGARQIPISTLDTANRHIAEKLRQIYKDTVLKDSNGRLLSFFVWNKYGEYRSRHTAFLYNLGTLVAAHDAYLAEKQKHNYLTKGRYEEYIVNATSPYFMTDTTGEFSPKAIAADMHKNGIFTHLEYKDIISREGAEISDRDSNAAKYLRQKIQEKGYDSIIYMNANADPGSMGVIVLDPSQMTLVSIDGKPIDENIASKNVAKSQLDLFDNNAKNWYNNKNIITDGSHLSNGNLKSNVKYMSGEYDYVYVTDELCRITDVHVEQLYYTERDERLNHNSNTPGKENDDHAGHLIGDRYGGSPDIDNLVSQTKLVNLSEYKKLENIWGRALNSGQKVGVDIKIQYDGNSMRPISFIVYYTIDGVKFKKIVNN